MIMGELFEKNLIIVLLSITGYFLFSISNSLIKSGKYNSDIRAFEKMKAYFNNKESSKFYKKEVSANSAIEVQFICEYCKKLTQQNIF